MGRPHRWAAVARPWIGLLVVGAAMWGVYRCARPPSPRTVVVTADTRAALEQRFASEHARPPNAEELSGLVDGWVEREILVREARARGLDRADPVVRRRLAQKMRFVLEDAEVPDDPGDAVLEALLTEHADDYRREARRGFVHVFVAGSDAAARERVAGIRAQLQAGAQPAELGDAFALGSRQPPATTEALADRYGRELGQAVQAAPAKRWIEARSSFGWHVLRIDEEHPGAVPPLAQVRPRVLADWRQQQRAAAERRGMAQLRERYTVEVAP